MGGVSIYCLICFCVYLLGLIVGLCMGFDCLDFDVSGFRLGFDLIVCYFLVRFHFI